MVLARLRLIFHKPLTEILETILSHGADIHFIDEEGLTIIHHICRCNYWKRCPVALPHREEYLQILLDHGVDVHIKDDRNGYIAFHYAFARQNRSFVTVLIRNSVELAMTSNSGATPLHMACYYANVDVIRLLLEEHGYAIDINAQDNLGYTPLHYIVRPMTCSDIRSYEVAYLCKEYITLRLQCVRLLLRNNANVTVRSCNGATIALFVIYDYEYHLRDDGSNINNCLYYCTYDQVTSCCLDIMKIILEYNTYHTISSIVNGYGDTLLHYAVK
jgi:ankyrin repeat protein